MDSSDLPVKDLETQRASNLSRPSIPMSCEHFGELMIALPNNRRGPITRGVDVCTDESI